MRCFTDNNLPTPEQKNFGDEVKALLLWLFGNYCAENNIGIYQRPKTSPIGFIHWLEDRDDSDIYDQWKDQKPDAPEPAPAVVDYVTTIPQRYNGLTGLLAFWPYLTLEYRETAHPVRAVSVGVLIHYEDGTIANLNRFMRAGVLSSEDISEADIISMVYGRALELAENMQVNSRDQIHDAYAGNRGCAEGDMFNYLAQLINSRQHPPAMLKKLQALMQLLPGLFVGVIDPSEIRKVCGLPADPAADARLKEKTRAALNGGAVERNEP